MCYVPDSRLCVVFFVRWARVEGSVRLFAFGNDCAYFVHCQEGEKERDDGNLSVGQAHYLLDRRHKTSTKSGLLDKVAKREREREREGDFLYVQVSEQCISQGVNERQFENTHSEESPNGSGNNDTN